MDKQKDINMVLKNEKKKYCNKAFKNGLSKALKCNFGEAENIEKIKEFNRITRHFSSERIIKFTNNVTLDVQKCVNKALASDPHDKDILEFAQLMDDISLGVKPQELSLVMKLNSIEDKNLNFVENGVNFNELNKFLYSAIKGSIDFTDMNEETKKILYETYNMLMEQVDKDFPDYFNDWKSKIGTGCSENVKENVLNLAKLFQDKTLNPLNLPFNFLMNGKLPD